MSKRFCTLFALGAFLGLNADANASGFGLIEQSVSSMGNAYAGGAAVAADATTIYFNPAGLTRLCRNQAIAGFHVVIPSADFCNDGSILTPLLGAAVIPPSNYQNPWPLTGGNGHDAGEAAIVGNFYLSRQINDCFWLGLGVTSPFGLITDYGDNWVGRYHGQRSSLRTVDINPVFAYKVNKCWSIGGGFRALYAHAKLTSAVDYGTITWLQTLNLPPEVAELAQLGLNALDFVPQEADGKVELKGNAWGYGGNFGILYEPCCGTRLGFNWRSQIKIKVKGDARFSDVPCEIMKPELLAFGDLQALIPLFQAIRAAGATDTKARSSVILPDLLQFSAYHEFNSCWAIMGDISWTRWKLLPALVFTFKNPNMPDAVTTLKWKNSFRYSVGVSYRPNSNWILRSGFAFDETPVKNKELRTPRIPDQDRYWLAFGLGYNINRCLHLDVAYAYLFVKEPKIDKTSFDLPEDITRGGLKGHYDANTNIVSAQLVYSF